jgi:CRP-like cAMP-binding protein
MTPTSIDSLQRVQFRAGDCLFREGEQSYFFYMIEEGKVDVVLGNPQDKNQEIHLATIESGQPVGEFALIAKQPRSATARAKTDVSVIKISEEAYQALLKDLPEWALSLLSSLIERIRKTDEMLRHAKFRDEDTNEKIQMIIESNSR